MATLLAEGIGDTIRYSLTADPVEEARAGRQLLEVMGLRERKNVDLIACPSCGRAEIDVIAVAKEAMEAFGEREIPLQVAVMGRSEEHTSELQSLMRISYAVFCLQKKNIDSDT